MNTIGIPVTLILRAAAREKVVRMMGLGFELAAIADGAGLARDTVREVLASSKFTRRSTLEAILDLDVDKPIEGHRVPNHIVMGLLDEMRACGLTLQWIYKTAGVSPKFRGSFSGQRVSWDNYERIARVYDAFFQSDLIALKEARDGATT